MKSNFGKNKKDEETNKETESSTEKKDFTKEEFEDFIIKAGAAGSYMVFRSKNKSDELGMDEL